MQISELVGTTIDKIGFSSIAATVGIKAAEAAEVITPTEYWIIENTLLISSIGGVLFAIKLMLDVSLKVMEIIKKANE